MSSQNKKSKTSNGIPGSFEEAHKLIHTSSDNETSFTRRLLFPWFKGPLEEGPPSARTVDHIRNNAHAVLFALLNNPLHAIVSTDDNGVVLGWNQAAQKFFGYEASEIIGHPSSMLFSSRYPVKHGGCKIEPIKGIPSLFLGTAVEVQGRHKNGNEFPIELSVSLWKPEQVTSLISGGYTAVIQDISTRKKAESEKRESTTRLEVALKALMESEAHWKVIVETSQDVIMLTSPSDGTITYLSPSCSSVFGYAPHDLIGQRPWIVHPEDLDRFKVLHYRALAGEPGTNVEYRINTKDKKIRWVSHSWSPIVDEEKAVVEIISIVRDITEIKRAEEARRTELKLETARTTAGGIAHDFNNVLAKIVAALSFAESLLGRIKESTPLAPVRKYLQTAATEAQHGSELIAQLMAFAKGTALQKSALSLSDPVANAAASCIEHEDGIELSCDFPNDLPFVCADPVQIKQVIHNIVTNAVQAMPHRGKIEITGHEISLGPNQMPQLPGGKYVKLSIRDQGIGISSENLEKIFEFSFTTKKQGDGHGIGLAISSQIIKEHGGHIEVVSESDKGTTFHIYLPVSE
ncbi:PAS domain S-box protein [Candidatus Micrarchaeota archaeon]|nr:PAS domain S-box protein [Candidatus Micrarchaeota archaeon]